jgi:thiol:disulfide interchange protein DsbD
MRRLLFLALGVSSLLSAAKEDPVQWTLSPVNGVSRVAPGSERYLQLKANIQQGWHLYSPTTPPGGPIPTRIRVAPNPNISEYKLYRPQPVRKLDPNFQLTRRLIRAM